MKLIVVDYLLGTLNMQKCITVAFLLYLKSVGEDVLREVYSLYIDACRGSRCAQARNYTDIEWNFGGISVERGR